MRGPRPRREPPASHARVLEASEPAPGHAAGAAGGELARAAWDVLPPRHCVLGTEVPRCCPASPLLSEDPVLTLTVRHFSNDLGWGGRAERLPFGGSSVGNSTNPNVQLVTHSKCWRRRSGRDGACASGVRGRAQARARGHARRRGHAPRRGHALRRAHEGRAGACARRVRLCGVLWDRQPRRVAFLLELNTINKQKAACGT